LSVVGIAGPGDPFANPEETIGTLKLVRDLYPSLLLCVATNGLNLLPFVDELAELNVSHVTITLNAVDPSIGAKIYSWVRHSGRTFLREEGAELLLNNQLKAIARLKEKGIVVKINTIIIPGINDKHIPDVAKKAGELGADMFNCMPMYPVEKTPFFTIEPPSFEMVKKVKKEASQYIAQMNHCTRCRADAVGLIGEDSILENAEALNACRDIYEDNNNVISNSRPYVAVASMEGVLVNQHLGEAPHVLIYELKNGSTNLVEVRTTPSAGGGLERWKKLSVLLEDCAIVLVNGIGDNPKKVLEESGLKTLVVDGMIDDVVKLVIEGKDINHLIKRNKFVCGSECSGTSTGCGG
jgi:nitrogen fixation protein NifB